MGNCQYKSSDQPWSECSNKDKCGVPGIKTRPWEIYKSEQGSGTCYERTNPEQQDCPIEPCTVDDLMPCSAPACSSSTPTPSYITPTPSYITPTPTPSYITPTPSYITPTPTPSYITPTPIIEKTFFEKYKVYIIAGISALVLLIIIILVLINKKD
jgi:hypothetical protein